MALVTIIITSFMLALSGAMMPGPLLSATISESARLGGRAGPLLILGHAFLELGMVAALLLGLAPLLSTDAAFAAIALTGALVLACMAWNMLKTLSTLSIDWDAHTPRAGGLVTSGILLSLANPYWTIWWATIGLGYILTCREWGMPGITAFFLGHIAGDLAWYALVSLLVARGRHRLSVRLYRGLIGVCAVFIAGFAGFFAWEGLTRLAG